MNKCEIMKIKANKSLDNFIKDNDKGDHHQSWQEKDKTCFWMISNPSYRKSKKEKWNAHNNGSQKHQGCSCWLEEAPNDRNIAQDINQGSEEKEYTTHHQDSRHHPDNQSLCFVSIDFSFDYFNAGECALMNEIYFWNRFEQLSESVATTTRCLSLTTNCIFVTFI